MNWFKRMVVRWVREDGEAVNQWADEGSNMKMRRGMGLNTISASSSPNGSLDSDANLTFTVYNAIGGKVVEFRRYDRKTDRSDHAVYVIGKDEDFGDKIAKIATLETLRG